MWALRVSRVDGVVDGVYDAVYVNFTDGLVFAGRVRVAAPVFATRLKSSWLESGAWERFLWAVPDDLLWRLATGQRVLFLDAGSRRRDCLPRTVWQGLPLLLYAVNRLWWRLDDGVAERSLADVLGVYVARGVDATIKSWYERSLGKALRARIRYWARYATPEPRYELVAAYTCGALTDEEAAAYERLIRARRPAALASPRAYVCRASCTRAPPPAPAPPARLSRRAS